MSILINMEMPKNCMLCSFCVEEADPANGEMCLVTGKLMPPCNHERLDDCPLIEVPPHGRLIDADALTVKLQRHREYHSDGSKSGAAISNGIGQCLDIINGKECTTIIPAEEGE